MTKFPMTAAGYSALQDELSQRMAIERPRLIQRMQEAIADDSNLAENSEYQAAQADQLINEARIVELEDKLATVTLINEDTNEKKMWRIVGEPTDRTSLNWKGQGRCRRGRGSNWCSDLPSPNGGMALMRAPRHAAIAVMALTAFTHAAAQDVGIFNPDAREIISSPDALEVPISPVVGPAVVPFDTALIEVPLPRPRPPLRDIIRENPVALISAFRQQHGEGPVAISGVLFGEVTEFSARLPSVLCGLCGVLLLARLV